MPDLSKFGPGAVLGLVLGLFFVWFIEIPANNARLAVVIFCIVFVSALWALMARVMGGAKIDRSN